MLSANFQTTKFDMTCSSPMRRAGPLAALARPIWSEMAIPLFSPSRVTEIAFKTTEALPASMARLLEDGSQESTSGDIASW